MKKLLLILTIFTLFLSVSRVTLAGGDPPVDVGNNPNIQKSSTIYKLLAPIGSLVCIDTNTDPNKREGLCRGWNW